MTNERKILIFGSVIVVGFVVMLIAVVLMFLRVRELYECQHAIMQYPHEGGMQGKWEWFDECRLHYYSYYDDLYEETDVRRYRFK